MEGRTASSASTGSRPTYSPPPQHHHQNACTDFGKALHTNRIQQWRRHSAAKYHGFTAKVQSHHLAHASVCMTLARQASVNGRKSARLKDCSKVRPTIAASCFPPACLVEAGSRGAGDRPVATFSTVLARVPTPASTPHDSKLEATTQSFMTLCFEVLLVASV